MFFFSIILFFIIFAIGKYKNSIIPKIIYDTICNNMSYFNDIDIKENLVLKKINKENMGTSNLGWLESRFHFSFADYRNPNNMNFGVLRVLNDDIIHGNSGLDTHSHENMEIISYVVRGEITHKDSLGNVETLEKGEVQYLSAGKGIYHSEHNLNSEDLRLLQMWIIPPKKDLLKLYGFYKYTKEQRQNKLLHVVSSLNGNSKVKIYQDINIFVAEAEKGKTLDFKINEE